MGEANCLENARTWMVAVLPRLLLSLCARVRADGAEELVLGHESGVTVLSASLFRHTLSLCVLCVKRG